MGVSERKEVNDFVSVSCSIYRIEQVRAQRLQGDRAEQDALMTIAQGLAAEEAKQGRGRGRGKSTKGRRGSRKQKKGPQAESPEAKRRAEESRAITREKRSKEEKEKQESAKRAFLKKQETDVSKANQAALLQIPTAFRPHRQLDKEMQKSSKNEQT